MNKKLCWITPDAFLDTDLDYRLISGILHQYDMHWIVLFNKKDNRFKECDFDVLLNENKNLDITFLYNNHRGRDPRTALYYLKIVKIVKSIKPDLIYLNMGPGSPWQLPLFYSLPKNITIVTAHQGKVHEGMGHYRYYNFFRNIYYGRFKFVNMFSKSQAELFKQRFPSSKVYQFFLGLKDFGNPTNTRPLSGKIRFLAFGTINYTKNLDLLIEAACLLHERGVENFVVSINGMCNNWYFYKEKIKYPELFELDIRLIQNEEIPNLFNGAHYLVQPYRVVSQSGPTKVAFRYNLPILCSNLPGFTDEVIEGVNGYYFEKGDAKDLADKMQMLIENHLTNYQNLLKIAKKHTEEHYSESNLIGQYVNMFNEVIHYYNK